MRNVYCPYCGRQAEYVDSKVIYGRSYGMAYLCRNCDAYVGVHRGTDEPLGRLADASLRKWKRPHTPHLTPSGRPGGSKENATPLIYGWPSSSGSR